MLIYIYKVVAPRVGAWIEIYCRILSAIAEFVAPRAGAQQNLKFGGVVMWWLIILCIIVAVIIFIAGSSYDNKRVSENTDNISKKLSASKFITEKEINHGSAITRDLYSVKVDVTNKRIAFCNIYNNQIKIYNFQDIIDCRVVQDGSAVIKGGLGRAIVGDILAGTTGAVIGAMTGKSKNVINKLQVQVFLQDVLNPIYTLDLITDETKKDSTSYKDATQFADELYATIISIINTNN